MDKKYEDLYKAIAEGASNLSMNIHALSGVTNGDNGLQAEDARMVVPFNVAQTKLREVMHNVRDMMDVHMDGEIKENAAQEALSKGNLSVVQ